MTSNDGQVVDGNYLAVESPDRQRNWLEQLTESLLNNSEDNLFHPCVISTSARSALFTTLENFASQRDCKSCGSESAATLQVKRASNPWLKNQEVTFWCQGRVL